LGLGKILAIDYGTTKIGLAVSDDARLLAFGRGVFDRKKGFPSLVTKLQEICNKEYVTELLFGLPLDENSEEGDSTKKVRNFAKKLGLYFADRKISFTDESFSSFEAKNQLRAAGRGGHDDEAAAVIILQRYLDRKQ
jgi:putative Holliday junction resolvase